MGGIRDLSPAECDLVKRVTAFVDDEVVPVAAHRDRVGAYPDDLVRRMKDLGLFGACTGSPVSYALICEEIGRGGSASPRSSTPTPPWSGP